MLRRTALMAWKETRHILRDPRTLYLAFGVPVVLLLLFGWALSLDVDHIRTLVIDRDKSALSRALVADFENSTLFDVVDRPEDERDITPAFRRGEAHVALVIPPQLARDLDRHVPAEVQMVVDGTNANVAAIALAWGDAIVSARALRLTRATLEAQGLAAGLPITAALDVKSRNWFNPDLRSQWYLVPGLVAVIMAMMSAILMALTVAREWEQGTMEQLLATPVRRAEIVLGKLLPYFVIGLGQLTLVTVAGVLLFGVPVLGSVPLLYALSSLFLCAALGQGLLISAVTRQQQLAMQVALLTALLPTILLSGFMSPIASMPAVLQALTHIIPARYFLVVTRGLFLKGSGLSVLWPQAVALALFAVILLAAAAGRMKTRVD